MPSELFVPVASVWLVLSVAVFVLLLFVPAPFGRHTSNRFGPTVGNRLGWFLMEIPSLAVMVAFLAAAPGSRASFVWILFALWILHYANRTLVWPRRIRPTPKRMPWAIVVSGCLFNLVNAGLNGWYLAVLSPSEGWGAAWLTSPGFLAGLALFAAGMAVNWIADTMLIRLRKKGETGYRIPRGFLFEYMAAPNLLGEIVEWAGFALMAWNPAALGFLAWTCANLIPRARNHRDWYRRNFPDYPPERKCLIPFIF
jgi:steroid 5-alpha reductase family enzyme